MADIQPIVTRPVPAPEETSPTEKPVASNRPAPSPDAGPAPPSRSDAPEAAPDPEQWAEALEQIRSALEEVRPPEWQVNIWEDQDTGSVVIEIQDEDGETVKQFPPEKILNLQRKLADLAGVVLDETH